MASISISVRHADVPKDLQQFAEEKVARLEKYLRGEPRLEFVIEKDKTNWRGEVILHGSRHHERLVAHDSHADAHGCVEMLVEKLEHQLGRSKERRKDHHGKASFGDGAAPPPPAPAGDEESYEDVVRRQLKGPEKK